MSDVLYRRHVECYIGCIQGSPAAFIALIHFVHPRTRKIRMIHRLVVLPDYQGIGIGMKLMTFVARRYISKGLRVRIVTSNPALRTSLKNSPNWCLMYKGRHKKHKNISADSSKRFTVSFEFKA